MSFLALDLGTSFIKAAVLDLDTYAVSHIRRVPFPEALPRLPDTRREFDPTVVIDAVRTLLEPLAAHCQPCEGLLICNQMHGMVWVNDAGEARSTLTTWQDQREVEQHPAGSTYYSVMTARLTDQQRHELGNELRPGLPAGRLFWQAEQRQLPATDQVAASIGDFVVAALCGIRPTTDQTNAHAHGLMHLQDRGWHAGVLHALGLANVQLPDIRADATIVGSIVGYCTLGDQRLACYPPIGDFQAALCGALVADDELSINVSTGSQVSMVRTALAAGPMQTRPYVDHRYVATVTTIPAGRSLAALLGLFTELATAQGLALVDPWDYIIEQANRATDSALQVNLSFFDSAVGNRGAMNEIREADLTIGQVFRAAFRNMADNYLHCALRLAPDRPWTRIVFSGGLAHRVPLLRTMISERCEVPYRVSPSSEDTLLGLLLLGRVFTQRAHDIRQATAQFDAHLSKTREA